MILRRLLALAFLSVSFSQAFADGFSLAFARETSPHLIVHLSPSQITEVGQKRSLTLTKEQQDNLTRNLKNVPQIFGVESLSEPDCSCCISPAMWTSTDKVTIWLDKYSPSKDLSKYYRDIRQEKRQFVMDADGNIFQAGQLVEFEEFVRQAKIGEHGVHLAMPPQPPVELEAKLVQLRKDGRVSSKL